MTRFPGLLVAIVLSAATASAGSGGSAYSIFGIGDLHSPAGMRNAGMGGAGLGLTSTSSISANSPAAWSRINRVRLETGVLYEGFNSTDGSRSLYRAAGTFEGALLAIPASTEYGVVFVGGFLPYSSVSYNTFSRGSQEGIDYVLNHKGSGGLGRGLVGLSCAPLSWLSFGASADYYFGSMERSRMFSPSSTTTLPAYGGTTTESITTHGLGVTASFIMENLGWADASLRPFSLGFTMSSRTKLNATSQTRFTYASEGDSSAETAGILVLPLSFGAGVGYQAGERYSLAADISTQLWERSEISGVTPADLRNSTRFAVGGERSGSRDPLAHWIDRVSYRLGFAYTATYYRPDGDPVNEWGITAGAGIPFSGEARINLGVEYAHRSGANTHRITDNIIRVLLSINISEEWFVRPEEE
jgi:hypothetical protein